MCLWSKLGSTKCVKVARKKYVCGRMYEFLGINYFTLLLIAGLASVVCMRGCMRVSEAEVSKYKPPINQE